MRILKVWILPCLTALVVLASAVLPQWLSRLGDQRLLGSVHTEEMAAENGLAFRTPDLLERLEMATAWSYDTGTLSVFTQEVSDESGELAEQVLAELRSLADSGVLPEELVLDETPNIQGLRVFLRDRETGLSTSFWCLDGKGTDMALYIVLDVESGHAVRLDFSHPALRKYAPCPCWPGRDSWTVWDWNMSPMATSGRPTLS